MKNETDIFHGQLTVSGDQQQNNL